MRDGYKTYVHGESSDNYRSEHNCFNRIIKRFGVEKKTKNSGYSLYLVVRDCGKYTQFSSTILIEINVSVAATRYFVFYFLFFFWQR